MSSELNRTTVTAKVRVITVKANVRVGGPKGDPGTPGDPATNLVTSVAGRQGAVLLSSSDVGLGMVNNTPDVDKPVSTATQAALNAKYDASNPAGFIDAATAASAAPVQSVAGRTGAVALAKADVGLPLADNTPDTDKPISTATQTALGGKATLLNIPQFTVPYRSTTGSGEANTNLTTAIAPTAGSLAYRTANGEVRTAAPLLADAATPKLYVDTADASKVDKSSTVNVVYATDASGNQSPLIYRSGVSTGSSIVQRLSTGQIVIADPTANTHAASKVYVDTQDASYDANVVHKAGAETVSGLKTFSNGQVFGAMTAPAYTPGLLYFDSAEDALTFYSSDPNVMMNIGQEQFLRVRNDTGSTIANGTPVTLGTSPVAGVPNVVVASNTTNALAQFVGLTTEAIASGAIGYVAIQGKVRGLNTSAFAVGAIVYLGASGALSTTAATSLSLAATVGTVLVSDATNGVVLVNASRPNSFTAQSATNDIGVVLSNLGLRQSGTAFPITTSGAATFNGLTTLAGNVASTAGSYRELLDTITATITLTTNTRKSQRVTASTAAINITLPSTTTPGYQFRFLRTDATAQVVTILGTINGNAAGYVLSAQYKYVELVSTGAAGVWEVWGNN